MRTLGLSHSEEEHIRAIYSLKTSIKDHLGMIYYITDIQAQCMASIISHLETVAVRKW